MTHKIKSLVFIGFFGIAAGTVVFIGSNKVAKANSTINPIPYTLMQVERAVDPDGKERLRIVRTTVVRQDGSDAVHEHRYYTADGKALDMPLYHVRDISTKRMTSVYPRVSGKISTKLQTNIESGLQLRSSDCRRPNYELAESTEKIGFQAVQLRTRSLAAESADASNIEFKEWVAPSLGCVVLKKEVIVRNAEGRLRGTTYVDFISIDVGTADAAKFALPNNFQEMSPSQVMKAQYLLEGRECKDCEIRTMMNADKVYNENRPTQ